MELPRAFETRMKNLLPEEEFQAFLEAYDQPRYKGIRTNTLKCDAAQMRGILPFATQPVDWCPTGFYIDPEVRPGKNPAYYAGLYYVQEPTAMAPVEALAPQPGDWVLDLCAAPGGKTSQIACKLGGTGLLAANELVVSRARILAENLERMGADNVMIFNAFPEHMIPVFYEAFDKILVDAPCSGEGMFRKDPAVLTQWSEERVTACAARQGKILETVDRLLKPGGVLVYSTCTFAPEENEQVIEALVQKGRYRVDPIALPGLEDHGRPEWTRDHCDCVAGTLRIMPYHTRGEGHFVARLIKTASCGEAPERSRKKQREGGGLKKAAKKELTDFRAFEAMYLRRSFTNLYRFKDRLFSLPEGVNGEELAGLRVLRAGLHLGDFKKERFEPSHTLAMALKPEDFKEVYTVRDDDEANAYLKGEPLASRDVQGWTLVCWRGFPLGFGKASQGVIKNHYPKGLRIRKK